MEAHSLLQVLVLRRFWPLFVVQFLGAFNDNVFRFALVTLITFELAPKMGANPAILNMVALALFIFPFFLLSASAGLMADKYPKHQLIRYIKLFELIIMLIAAWGFVQQDVYVLMFSLMLTGLQSALFGPVKYGILPDLLQRSELLAGNALIEAGTFLSILLGTILGGLLILLPQGDVYVSTTLVAVAAFGLWASTLVQKIQPADATLKMRWNVASEIRDVLKIGLQRHELRRVIIGISWFWMLGSVVQSQLAPLAKQSLQSDQQVAVLFLVMFTLGIGIGSLLCHRVLKGEISGRYVSFAAILMSWFSLDLYWAVSALTLPVSGELYSLGEFLANSAHWRVLFDMFALSIASGFYIVPLYTLMQSRSGEDTRSRTIAANNILNALFMVIASILVIAVLSLSFEVIDLYWMLAILNFGVAIYIMSLLPRENLKALGRILFRLLYRVEIKGMENYPKEGGPYVIVANHTSFLDGPLLMSYLPEMPVFAINKDVNEKWWAKIFTRFFEMYPLDASNPMAVKGLVKMLREGRNVVIFPEGRITFTGGLMKIYEGPGKIAELGNADLIPVRIDGAQYTPLSRLRKLVRIRHFPKVTLTICKPVRLNLPEDVRGKSKKEALRVALYDVMRQMMFETTPTDQTLFERLLAAMKIHGKSHRILEDIERSPITYKRLLLGSLVLGDKLEKTLADEKHIGMLLPNTIGCVVTFFALQARAYVPAMLNFSAGADSIAAAIKGAEIKTVLTARKFIELAELDDLIEHLETKVRIIYLEDIREQVTVVDKLKGLLSSFFPRDAMQKQKSSEDPAVILFTSGSEGTPKGVVLSHKNILSNHAQAQVCADFSPKDVFFSALPVFHSFGMTVGMLLPIMTGSRCFLYPSPLHYKVIPELVYDTRATVMFGTDTFLNGYAQHADQEDFQTVRYLIAGAEKLKDTTRKVWMEKFGIRVHEGYGVTETSPALSINTYTHYKAGSVGRLCPGIDYRIDPIEGVEQGGRLHVRGPNIMLGYLRAEAPGQLEPPEEGWHDTGDIVDVDEDGFVTILGRAKRFAKIGGEMVSLTKVEGWVSDLWPEHMHCVCAVSDPRKGEKLVLVTEYEAAQRKPLQSYIVENGGSELMAPKEIMHLKQLPVLGTGKLDYPSVQKQVEKQFAA